MAALVASDPVVLEPDALLEIEMPGLAEEVTALDLPSPSSPAAAAHLAECGSWSFLGADRFAIAVEPASFGKSRHRTGRLGIGFELGAQDRIAVDLFLREGLRARAVLPDLVSEVVVAPVNVELSSSYGLPMTGTTTLTIWSLPSERPLLLRTWTFDWGTVSLETKDEVAQLSVNGETATATLVLGRRYRIGAESATGAAGSVEFTHDGGSIAIELQPGVRMSGVLVGNDETLPATARGWWIWDQSGPNETPPASSRWLNGSASIPIEPEGAFELIAPRRGFPGRPPRSLVPPNSVRLTLLVGGFSPVELAVDLDGRYEVDLGEIQLQRAEPDLLLSSHPFRAAEDIQGSPVRVSADSVPGWFEVRTARTTEEGGIEIFLVRTAGAKAPEDFHFRDATGGQRGVVFPLPAPEVIVVHGRQEGIEGTLPFLFARSTRSHGARCYDWIDGRPRTVRVEFLGAPPEAFEVHMGWSWGSVFVPTKTFPGRGATKQSFEFTFAAPDGASFWWTWTTMGPYTFVWPPVSRALVRDSEALTIRR